MEGLAHRDVRVLSPSSFMMWLEVGCMDGRKERERLSTHHVISTALGSRDTLVSKPDTVPLLVELTLLS